MSERNHIGYVERESVTEWGVRNSDGRVQAFRYKEAAVEHLAWRKKFRYVGDQLVSRSVTYSDWALDQSIGGGE